MRHKSSTRLVAIRIILLLAFFLTATADLCIAQNSGGFSSEGPASSGELSSAAYDSGTSPTVSAAQFSSMQCTPVKVTVGWMGAHTVTYYQCGTDWYMKAYLGRSVSYVLVQPPDNADF